MKNIGCMTIPSTTTEEMLAIALHDLLENDCISSVEYACFVLGHPDTVNGACICGSRHTDKIKYTAHKDLRLQWI
jgi:hypothetical protein